MKKRKYIIVLITITLWLITTSVLGLSVDAVTPINDRDYAPAMMTLLKNAQKNIKLMLYQTRFYDKYPDTMSNKFLEELFRALKRGVYVTAILDISDWNKENIKYNTDFATRLARAGAEVYLDNPEIVSHQKVVLIDDVISVVGSVNWSYYSLAKNHEVATIIWSAEVNKAYTKYFNERLAESERFFPEMPSPDLELARKNNLTLLPAKDVEPINNRDYFPAVHRAITQANKRVWVAQMSAMYYMVRPSYAPATLPTTTTVVPSLTNLLLKDLIRAHKRGVDVRVLLDVQENRTNVNLDFANRLLAHGVKVYYDDPKVTLHAKMLLVDDEITVVGSTNWSLNALEIGNEASVLIHSQKVNQVYADYFLNLLKQSTLITPTSEFVEPQITSPTQASRN